jgi:hypothetical protein
MPLDGYELQAFNSDGSPCSPFPSLQITGSVGTDGYFLIVHPMAQDLNPSLWGAMLQGGMAAEFADLQNGPDALVLLDFALNQIDAVGYGGPPNVMAEGPHAPDVPAGSSLSRNCFHVDTNNNFLDFQQTAPTPHANRIGCPP